jgi:hypothetical protein
MTNTDFTATIQLSKSPQVVFDRIKEIPKWWTKDFEGNSKNLNDEFVIRHSDLHYSKQKLIEVIPDKKLVWLVTDSKLDWLKDDKEEWTNTKMIFEISTESDKTVLHFTHQGLVPAKACYPRCTEGWKTVIKDHLSRLINDGISI